MQCTHHISHGQPGMSIAHLRRQATPGRQQGQAGRQAALVAAAENRLQALDQRVAVQLAADADAALQLEQSTAVGGAVGLEGKPPLALAAASEWQADKRRLEPQR